MKYLKQFAVIMIVSFAGELLHSCLPLPVPASIYGFVLMFVLLLTGILKLSDVKETSHFLIEIMPVMFIPSSVGLITVFALLKPLLLPYAVITVVSTFIVMLVAGRVTQALIRGKRKEASDEGDA